MSVNHETIVQTLIEEYGLNPMLTYCQVTGKPFGTINAEIFDDIIDSIGGDDEEEIAGDLFARTLFSMRPSPVWNSITPDTIQRFAKSRPYEVLAYCLNRLYEPHNGLKVPSDERARRLFQRVQVWQAIQWLRDNSVVIDELLYMLVEIDAKYNLTNLPVPGGNLVVQLAELGDSFIYDDMMKAWSEWYWPLQEDYLRRLKLAEQQSRWLKGNSLAKAAHFTMFMESKPPSKAAEKIAAKKESADFFANIFAEVASIDLKTREITPKPFDLTKVVVPVTTAPRRFGGFKTQEA